MYVYVMCRTTRSVREVLYSVAAKRYIIHKLIIIRDVLTMSMAD